MPALQVRELPQDIYDELKARADKEHRSLSQQTIVLLQQALAAGKQSAQQPPVELGARKVSYEDALAGWQYPSDETREERIARRKRLFEEIDKLPAIDLPPDFPSAAELNREDRDSR